QRRDVNALFGKIRHEIQDDVTLAERIEHVGGAHEFIQSCGNVNRIRLQREPQLNLVKAESGARKLSVIGGGMARGSFIAGAHLVVGANCLGGAASPV